MFRTKLQWLLVWFSLTSEGLCADGIFTDIVQIDQGLVRGLRSVSGQNRYYGITYAVSRRFEVSTYLNTVQFAGLFCYIVRVR